MAAATVNSKWINGELVFYNGANDLIHIPNGVGVNSNFTKSTGILSQRHYSRYFENFSNVLDDGAASIIGWDLTAVEVGAGTSTVMVYSEANFGYDAGADMIKLDAAANDNDGAQIQKNGTGQVLVVGVPMYFGARVRITEATQSDAIVGLCSTDNSVITAVADGVYFRTADGAATATFVCENTNTETEAVEIAAVAADTWYDLGFLWDGVTTVTPYVGGSPGTGVITNIPTAALTPTFAWLNGAGTMQHDGMFIDWVEVVTLR